jgi:hypothetical protein
MKEDTFGDVDGDGRIILVAEIVFNELIGFELPL